jgi:hypothetical protein
MGKAKSWKAKIKEEGFTTETQRAQSGEKWLSGRVVKWSNERWEAVKAA